MRKKRHTKKTARKKGEKTGSGRRDSTANVRV